MDLMISCKKASELISRSLERPLTPWEWLKLRYHLSICEGCAFWSKQIRGLRTLFHRRRETSWDASSHLTALSPEARARIQSALRP